MGSCQWHKHTRLGTFNIHKICCLPPIRSAQYSTSTIFRLEALYNTVLDSRTCVQVGQAMPRQLHLQANGTDQASGITHARHAASHEGAACCSACVAQARCRSRQGPQPCSPVLTSSETTAAATVNHNGVEPAYTHVEEWHAAVACSKQRAGQEPGGKASFKGFCQETVKSTKTLRALVQLNCLRWAWPR